MQIKPIPSIPGAFAREDGCIKLPECEAVMPHGGTRVYKTKWVAGAVRRAKKGAAHCYRGIKYRGKNYKIHRLVCEAFHGQPPAGREIVLHADEDGLNNRPDNLSWGTQKENLTAPRFIAYCKGRTGDKNPFIKGKASRVTRNTAKRELMRHD